VILRKSISGYKRNRMLNPTIKLINRLAERKGNSPENKSAIVNYSFALQGDESWQNTAGVHLCRRP
jgi:hypothetical protein